MSVNTVIGVTNAREHCLPYHTRARADVCVGYMQMV